MNKSPQYNQQTESMQSKSEVEKICIYQNLKVAVTSALSKNKQWVPCQKESQATIARYLKLVAFSGGSCSKKHIYVYNHAAQIIINRIDHPAVHEKQESFNITQTKTRPGPVFFRGLTHIQNLFTVCIKLTQVGG